VCDMYRESSRDEQSVLPQRAPRHVTYLSIPLYMDDDGFFSLLLFLLHLFFSSFFFFRLLSPPSSLLSFAPLVSAGVDCAVRGLQGSNAESKAKSIY